MSTFNVRSTSTPIKSSNGVNNLGLKNGFSNKSTPTSTLKNKNQLTKEEIEARELGIDNEDEDDDQNGDESVGGPESSIPKIEDDEEEEQEQAEQEQEEEEKKPEAKKPAIRQVINSNSDVNDVNSAVSNHYENQKEKKNLSVKNKLKKELGNAMKAPVPIPSVLKSKPKVDFADIAKMVNSVVESVQSEQAPAMKYILVKSSKRIDSKMYPFIYVPGSSNGKTTTWNEVLNSKGGEFGGSEYIMTDLCFHQGNLQDAEFDDNVEIIIWVRKYEDTLDPLDKYLAHFVDLFNNKPVFNFRPYGGNNPLQDLIPNYDEKSNRGRRNTNSFRERDNNSAPNLRSMSRNRRSNNNMVVDEIKTMTTKMIELFSKLSPEERVFLRNEDLLDINVVISKLSSLTADSLKGKIDAYNAKMQQ